MSFGPGHVVVLLIVIALVVPALLQVWWRSGLPVLRPQHAQQHAAAMGRAPGRSSSPLPEGLKADHPVLFLSRHILGHSARDACSSLRISREHLSRRPRGCPFLTDPVRDSGRKRNSADLDGSAANRPGGAVRCVRR